MGEIKVAFAALEVARGDVVGMATRIAGRLDDLRRAVVLLAASWEGRPPRSTGPGNGSGMRRPRT